MTALSPLDAAVRDLTQLPNFVRVKKLMVYACTHQWVSRESDLVAYHLHELTQTLVHHASTVEQLETYLYQIVATLTKPAEYSSVAQSILNTLRPVYPCVQGRQVEKENYEMTAWQLNQRSDRHRIKKLLICLCYNRWENDPQQLEHINMVDLIRQTHRLVPTLDRLQVAVANVVKTLSKPTEYKQLADSLLADLASLYHADSPQLPSAAVSQPPQPQATVPQPDSQNPQKAPRRKPPDAFDLRLEIMKFTNPLRAKILLFAALTGSIECSDRHWPVVRERELDDLLSAILQMASGYDELEKHLQAIAQTSKGSKESTIYLQVASAILKAVNVYYLVSPRSRTTRSQTPPADLPTQANAGVSIQPMPSSRSPLPDANELEPTCQIQAWGDRPGDKPHQSDPLVCD